MILHKISGTAILSMLAILMMATILCAQDDIDEHRGCIHCGMDRKAYGFSRMMVSYDDGTAAVGVCSLHCVVVELNANTARKVKNIDVADRDTRTLINAGKAYWVIGGNKPGVMSKTATWAYAEKKTAEKFLKEHGGSLASFKEALDVASQEITRKGGDVSK
jgi:copper chaperone NosL